MPSSDTDGPIHLWFSLSYSSYLVLDSARLRKMPADWDAELTTLLGEFWRAFAHVSTATETLALAGERWEYGDLTAEQMRLADVATNLAELHEDCACGPEPEQADDEPDEQFVARYRAWEGARWDHEGEGQRWYDWRSDEYERWMRLVVPDETEQQASAAGRIVLSRSLLQSMPLDWQDRFVTLIGQVDDGPAAYDIRFYDHTGRRMDDPVPDYSRGRTYIEPRLEPSA